MTDIINQIPRLSETKKYIEKLKKAQWPDVSDFKNSTEYLKAVEKVLFCDFEIIPDIKKILKPSEFQLPFFRAREIESFTNINFFSEHSYPPINLTGFNRCNYPKSPVFYCSDNPLTALMELIRDKDHGALTFCLSKWELNDSNENLIFQTFLQTELNPGNRFTELREAELAQLGVPFDEKLDEDQRASLTELLKFLHNSFITDNNYALSASLAHRILNPIHNYSTDILMYPSIQTKYKGINMAIHPNFVDNRMRVKRFYIIQLANYDIDTEKFDISVSKYGILNNNKIIWRLIDPKDEDFLKHFNYDFQHLIESGFKSSINEI